MSRSESACRACQDALAPDGPGGSASAGGGPVPGLGSAVFGTGRGRLADWPDHVQVRNAANRRGDV